MKKDYNNQLVLLRRLMEDRNIDKASIEYVFEGLLKEFIRIDTDMPIGVNALIINEKGELLLSKRGRNAFCGGTWGLPGGHLKKEESLEEGIARECKEELGIEVNPREVEIVSMGDCMGDKRYLQIGGVIRRRQRKIMIKEPEKTDELKFFSLDKIPKGLFFGTKVNIDLFLERKFYDRRCNYYKK